MKANSINLQKIFEQTIRYRIPLFQRPYVWTEEENWQPVWEDVRILTERYLQRGDAPPHFLGAIVLDQLRGSTGTVEVRQVIDGQQRLTTLQLLLAALRDLAQTHGEQRYASRFAKLTANDESFCDQPNDEFKVWLTNRDQEDYRKTMGAGSPEEIRQIYNISQKKRRVEVRIPDTYLYFHRVLSEWLARNGETEDGEEPLESSTEDRFEALWSVVRGHLLLVAIDLDDDDDAQIIFETLNARGTQLLPADLVKNYLFHMAELEEAPIEDFYSTYWSQFDTDFWREEVRQGRLKRPRIDLFLQHYLTLKTNDEVNAGHIFGVFKHYADTSVKTDRENSGQEVKETAEHHLKQLTEYGLVFREFDTPAVASQAEVFFERLRAIDTATVFPFLLEAFKSLGQPDQRGQLDQILTTLESFLTRRMICGLTTKNYNRLFLDLIRDAEKEGGITLKAVQSFLLRLEADSNRWPNDREFSVAWMNKDFYNSLSQAKQRMVLVAINQALESPKSEAIRIATGSLTVEHLLPQSWHTHWPLPLDNEDDPIERQQTQEKRERLLHTLGNLTLLSDKLNPAISNSAWTTKRPEILKNSKLNLNRYFQEVEEWNEDQIEQRALTLFQVASRIWPHPTMH